MSSEQIGLVDGLSRELLHDPGILCYNSRAADIFSLAGAAVEPADGCTRVRITDDIVDRALASVPSIVVLGARDPDNRLILNAHEPRVRFGSGSETNFWLDVDLSGPTPVFTRRSGNIELLCRAAHLCENLDNLDFFIRCVNIRDDEITEANKDVNKFYASLNNTTKHVQGGLTSLAALDDVLDLGRIVAGGEDAFNQNPVLSFITCVVKSPLQMVEDTADKLMEISRRRVPVVISSSPMGGATAPFDEFGMVAQINAELLAGIALNQLVSPGAPVLYGAVPVRTRLDNLNDMYAAPEFVHYNMDCAQMALHYGLPCYSSAGVGDASVPGIQANAEKLITLLSVPRAGAQYIHYAFGLLDRTNVFCPEQAVIDDAHIGIAKEILTPAKIDLHRRDEVAAMIAEVMATNHKTYVYHLPLPSREQVYVKYPLEDDGGALRAAHDKYRAIMDMPRKPISSDQQQEIMSSIPDILGQCMVF
jgi:trimethylamine--corrinoid protein Co-methyltransferase